MKLILSSFLAALVATQVTVNADDSLDLLVKKAHTTVQTQQSTIHHLPAESRIVGGTDAAANAYPSFVVSLSRSLCGGTLIWEDLVLTAAHCAGAWDDDVIVSPNSGSAGQIRSTNTQLQRVHPSYTSSTIDGFDFMVVKLNNPVTNPVLMTLNEEFNDPATGDDLKVIGYGRLSEDGGLPNRLQEVTVKKITFTTCNQQYGGSIIDSIMICAGVDGGGKDSCQGDSGGPLFNPAGEQVDLVSFGIGCGQANFPGVYSHVSGAYDWINDRICELADNKPCTCDDTCGGVVTQTVVGLSLRTDRFPEDTRVTLTNNLTNVPIWDFSYGASNSDFFDTVRVAESGCYLFRIFDSFGDGLCCRQGNGGYSLSLDNIVMKSGGNFRAGESFEFGQCGGNVNIQANPDIFFSGQSIQYASLGSTGRIIFDYTPDYKRVVVSVPRRKFTFFSSGGIAASTSGDVVTLSGFGDARFQVVGSQPFVLVVDTNQERVRFTIPGYDSGEQDADVDIST